jgi:hypothetical protein
VLKHRALLAFEQFASVVAVDSTDAASMLPHITRRAQRGAVIAAAQDAIGNERTKQQRGDMRGWTRLRHVRQCQWPSRRVRRGDFQHLELHKTQKKQNPPQRAGLQKETRSS